MANIQLNAAIRTDVGKKVRTVRENNRIPCILYGNNNKPSPLDVDYQEFRRVYHTAGQSSIVEISVEKKKVPVLIHEVQSHPARGTYSHVDFYAVNMKEKIHTSIPIHFVGDSDAVKLLGGTLVYAKESIDIQCLPGDLLHSIDADLSKLVDFHSKIVVGDLSLPDTIEVLDSDDVILASVTAPRIEEEPEAVETVEGEAAEGEKEGESSDEGKEKA